MSEVIDSCIWNPVIIDGWNIWAIKVNVTKTEVFYLGEGFSWKFWKFFFVCLFVDLWIYKMGL